jgi:hypothetical protein
MATDRIVRLRDGRVDLAGGTGTGVAGGYPA